MNNFRGNETLRHKTEQIIGMVHNSDRAIMKKKKVFVFVLLMLPNIVLASLVVSICQIAASSVLAASGMFAGTLGGAGYGMCCASIESSEKVHRNLLPSREEEIKDQLRTIGGYTLSGALVGFSIGWSIPEYLAKSVEEKIKNIRSP